MGGGRGWLIKSLPILCGKAHLRRILRMASEDIGNADPRALQIVLDAWETYERVGNSREKREFTLAQAVVYCGLCT